MGWQRAASNDMMRRDVDAENMRAVCVAARGISVVAFLELCELVIGMDRHGVQFRLITCFP